MKLSHPNAGKVVQDTRHRAGGYTNCGKKEKEPVLWSIIHNRRERGKQRSAFHSMAAQKRIEVLQDSGFAKRGGGKKKKGAGRRAIAAESKKREREGRSNSVEEGGEQEEGRGVSTDACEERGKGEVQLTGPSQKGGRI